MKKKINIPSIILLITSLIVIFNNIYLLFNIKGLHNIENTFRLIGAIIIVLLSLLIIFINLKILIKKNKKIFIIMIIINIFLILFIGFINFNFNIIYSRLNKVTTNYTTYSISLVTSTSNKAKTIDDIGNADLGVINDHEIANGYVFAEEIVKNFKLDNKLVEYESYFEIIDDLIKGKIEYGFLPSNYIEAFSSVEGYEHIADKLKTIYETSKQEKTVTNEKNINEPFTILLMGVDGTGDGIANMTANGDSLILITFNPQTLKVTMLSIPRDSYVPISCMGGKKNKITHSSWGGEKCIMNTIEKLTGVTIDYYVKINFNGVVELVDTLGGVDVDVEYSFCEQNSKRHFGNETIYVKKGFQTLNGEQALAYSRNRHPNPEYCSGEWTNYDSNDFIRGAHQQDVIKAITTKIKNIRDLNTLYSLLNTISNNMATNMSTNTILSFYNLAKDLSSKFLSNTSIEDILSIEKLYLNGYGAMIYDYSQFTNSGSKLVLWDYVLYNGSVNDVSEAMKINLGSKEITPIKTFSYDAANPYEQSIIGKKTYGEGSIALLPNFVGQTKEQVQSYANAHNLKLAIEYVNNSAKAGTVLSQDPGAKMDISEISSTKGIKITVAQGNGKFDYSSCGIEQYKDHASCQMSDFTGKTYESFKKWLSNYSSLKLNVSYSIIDDKMDSYDEEKAGLIESITADGKKITSSSIYNIKNSKILVTYYGQKTKEEDKEEKPTTPTTPTTPEDNSSDNNNDNND